MWAVGWIATLAVSLLHLWTASVDAASLEPVGSFNRPIFVTSDPEDPERLIVVEREGLVVEDGNGGPAVVADLTGLVSCCESERGLLSIALAPDFASSGRFYAAYTGTLAAGGEEGDVHVDAFRPDGAGDLEREPILSVGHSTNANHNGGQLQFGPDGHLYVSIGDGGGSGDPLDAAQDLGTLLGKLLRIDPRPGESPAYAIPPDNPLVGVPGRDEIWSYGLRNPWRFSFDRESGDLTIADVGQGAREEIDHAPSPTPGAVGGAGANFGWDCREGLIEYTGPPDGPSPVCGETFEFTDPVFDYPHTDSGEGNAHGCSITGGYVVRDASLGELLGRYVYGDFCVGQIRSIDLSAPDPPATDRAEPGLSVPAFSLYSFGEDSCGRIYVATGDGPVYRLEGDEPAGCTAEESTDPDPEPTPTPTPALPTPLLSPPPPSARQPGTVHLLARFGRRRVRARGLHVRIVVRVRPCAGHAGRRLLLNRGGRRFAAKRLNRRCVARFHVRIANRSTFRALFRSMGRVGFVRSRTLSVRRPRR